MGDRGNIVIQEAPGKRVYLYTHWSGSDIAKTAKRALARKQRWNDPAYLARIVFCEMIGHDDVGALQGETGFGISTGLCDNEHPILVVDVEHQSVFYEDPDAVGANDHTHGKTFEEFIK